MRKILMAAAAAGTGSEADRAISLFCYRVRKTIGAFMAVLGGVDVISFGGGIGEHQAQIRARILDGLAEMGIRVDPNRNSKAAGFSKLHPDGSATAVYLTPVNEMQEMLMQYGGLEAIQRNSAGDKI